MMEGIVANKAATSSKEQISIMLIQSGKSVKSSAIDFDKDRGREARLVEELNPVQVVVIGHGILLYSHAPQSSFIPPTQSQKNR
jgi:hypothetical protein